MEDNKKKDSVDAEVVSEKTVSTEAKKEEEKKAYDKDNLTRAIIYAAIVVTLQFLHMVLGGISGNLPWMIINLIFTAAGVVMIILCALFFFKTTMKNLKNDIPSFVVSLVALVVITFSTLGWNIDFFVNLSGLINELANK